MESIKKLTIILIILLSIFTIILRLSEMNVKYSEAEYIVQEGDTLWEIAEEYASEHQSIQEYIYQLKQVNNIASEIEVGQVITIFK